MDDNSAYNQHCRYDELCYDKGISESGGFIQAFARNPFSLDDINRQKRRQEKGGITA
jgi:hypothetical protein